MICLGCCIRRSFTREVDKAHYDKNGQDTSKILEDHRDIEGRNNRWEMTKGSPNKQETDGHCRDSR